MIILITQLSHVAFAYLHLDKMIDIWTRQWSLQGWSMDGQDIEFLHKKSKS